MGIRLDHPGIVRYFGKGVDIDGLFLIEEFVDGETLEDYIAHNVPLPDAEVRRIIMELAEAVAYLHEFGIVHADLKPDNLIITRQGHHPKLIDLGFASHYSYPPVKEGDTRADILSLGRLLEAMAPGRFQRVIRKATNEQPDKRYQTVGEMASDLNRKRGRWLAIASAILILAALCSPFFRKLAAPAPQVITVRDTLVIRDTVFSLTPPASPSIPEQFRQSVRKEAEALYAPFYASFDKVTSDNMDSLIQQNQQLFGTLQQRTEQMTDEWSRKYPGNKDYFRQITSEEHNRILQRFQSALTK